MAKQLIKQCNGVRLNGIHITQGQTPDGWQAYILMDGALVNIDGDDMRIGLSGSKKELLGAPQASPWTLADFEDKKGVIFARIQDLYNESLIEYTGST